MQRLIALAWAGALTLVLFAGSARADDPKWEEAKKDDKSTKEVEWKAAAQAGLIITTGNSETTTISGGINASRKAGFNKFQIATSGAFARSSLYIASDVNGDGAISAGEIQRPTQTTTRAWDINARYDRFLTEHNSLYVLAKLASDKPAGKELVAGAQAGYSRQLYHSDIHDVTGEVGYDYSFEDLTAGDGVSIHSGRAFIGWAAKLSDDTGINTSGEILVNVNKLNTPTGPVNRFEDTRFTGKVELTTKLHENISFNFGFTAKYDNAPAPRPPFAVPYAPGFLPLADKLDTITKASLIINFL